VTFLDAALVVLEACGRAMTAAEIVDEARMSTREALHQLIDDLPESALPTAWSLLAPLRPDATACLPRILVEAPWKDEPETPEEALAVQEAYEGLARGEVISHEELRLELGW
jgi:hypothetical protein